MNEAMRNREAEPARWYGRYSPSDMDEMDLEGVYEEHAEATNMACECRYCTYFAVSNGWQ